MAARVFLGMLVGGASGFGFGLWRANAFGPNNAAKHSNYGSFMVEIMFSTGELFVKTGFWCIVGGVIGAGVGLLTAK